MLRLVLRNGSIDQACPQRKFATGPSTLASNNPSDPTTLNFDTATAKVTEFHNTLGRFIEQNPDLGWNDMVNNAISLMPWRRGE